MLRYHHSGAIYWGTAAYASVLQPAPECTLCGVAHDHLHHLLFDCARTQSLRDRWPGAVAHLQHSAGPFKNHLLVLAPVPDTRDSLQRNLYAQAFTLLAIQMRRDANDAWRKLQGQRFAPATQIIPEHLLRARAAELTRRYAPREPGCRPPPKGDSRPPKRLFCPPDGNDFADTPPLTATDTSSKRRRVK